jgi:phage portal protein BeeE
VDLSNPLARLLRYSPNQYMTAQEFREAMTMQLCFYGNAYALVDRNSAGDVISLLPLQSANMDVKLVGKKWFIAINATANTPTFRRERFSP